jgi:hypothetical protein
MDNGDHQRGIVSRQQATRPTTSGAVTTSRRAADLPDAQISEMLTRPSMTAPEIAANARVFLKALFFDPKLSDDEMRVFESHYVETLAEVPAWAARKAFTNLAGDASRRALPRPGEVKAEAIRVMEPLRLVAKNRARAALPSPPQKSPADRAASSERMADVMAALRAVAGAAKI